MSRTREGYTGLDRTPGCPVVGIGASAGGLQAIRALLANLPSRSGMAYIFVQHLDPSHPSLLPDLLRRSTSLPVCEIEQGMLVEPDTVYVLPANADLTVEQGIFQLHPRAAKGSKQGGIDRFFTSLSQTPVRPLVGVLLSGTATDGVAGLQAIKARGGITFVEDPAFASFPQLPRSAIAAGGVDHVLSPEAIAEAIVRLARKEDQGMRAQSLAAQVGKGIKDESEASSFTSLLHLLSQQSGVDFATSYKPATLMRRVRSRMALLSLSDLSAYKTYLEQHPDEIEALTQSVLIAVTDFFRDPAVFEALTRLVWPSLVAERSTEEPLRIWVPGCATGEETYSLAISLQEFLEEHAPALSFQIFASDINPRVIAVARTGIYPASALATVEPSRKTRFFTLLDRQYSRYRIIQDLRERCVFAQHNLLRDPPFIRLDLISCRNVLIYLRASVQHQVLSTFHYALMPEGFLLLGTAESIEPFSRLFRRVEGGQHLYRKLTFGGSSLPPLGVGHGMTTTPIAEKGGVSMAEETNQGANIIQTADRLLLSRYVPASVVVDANAEVLQVRGQTDPYLQLVTGRASLNLLRMARPGLAVGLRAALAAARKQRHPVIREGLHVSAFGTTRTVRVTVIPLKGPPASHYSLVLFEEQKDREIPDGAMTETHQAASRRARGDRAQKRILELEQELVTMQTEVQEMLEERDVANEELQTANEEIRASNEELRSLNEELETSKEELQTINEELSTANQELRTRNEQLKDAQDYADSIVETVRSPLVVLTEDLRVERANVAFYQFFQAIPAETEGCLLSELGDGRWGIPDLLTALKEIIPTNHSFSDFEVDLTFPRIGHKTLLLNARHLLISRQPVRDHRILLAMEDVTERRAEERRREAHMALLQRILDILPASVYLVRGKEARLVLSNRATTVLWGAAWPVGQPMVEFLEEQGVRIFDSGGQMLAPSSFATIRVLHEGKAIMNHQQVIHHADGTSFPVLVHAVPLGQDLLIEEGDVGKDSSASAEPAAIVVHEDVTALKETEALKESVLSLVAHELRTPLAAVKGFATMLLTQTARGNGPPLADWQHEAIAEIDLAADRLARLATDLLDVARLQAGELSLTRSPADLVDVIRHALSQIQRQTERQHLTFTTIPPDLSHLQAYLDRGRIEQVLTNLLGNAIKYDPDGGPVEVSLRAEMERHTALISVTDHGIGIPKEEHARLFGRFVRASNAETQGIGGSGLGLYLCRELVLLHGGEIWFESREGEGSTFFVRLPLLEDSSEREAKD